MWRFPKVGLVPAHGDASSIDLLSTPHTMATDKKGLLSLAKSAKARQAARRFAAKKRSANAADTTEDLVEMVLDDDEGGTGMKRKRPAPAQKGAEKSPKTKKRLRADELNWMSVNTSSLPGMDAGGGMMMLEELDGVGVEWEDGPDGGRTARFIVCLLEGRADSRRLERAGRRARANPGRSWRRVKRRSRSRVKASRRSRERSLRPTQRPTNPTNSRSLLLPASRLRTSTPRTTTSSRWSPRSTTKNSLRGRRLGCTRQSSKVFWIRDSRSRRTSSSAQSPQLWRGTTLSALPRP